MLRLSLVLALILGLAACHKPGLTIKYACDEEGLTRVDLFCRNAPEGDDVMLTDAVWQVSLAVGPAAYHVHGICHIRWAWIFPEYSEARVCGAYLDGQGQALTGIYVDPFDGMCPGCKGDR